MANIKGVHKLFGTILRIEGDFFLTDLKNIDRVFGSSKSVNQTYFLDLARVRNIDSTVIPALLARIKELNKQGISVTIVQATDEIRKAIKMAEMDSPVWTIDSLDEAVFPFKTNLKPRIEKKAVTRPGTEKCPGCGQPLRSGAFKCLHCGYVIHPRRSDRRTLAVPFFYGNVINREFLDSAWKGAVTEDLDVKMFSGIGFFSPNPIPVQTELFFIFPTMQWESKEQNQTSLTIFTGRIKHCAEAGEWYRIGVALYDMFEYEGRFDVKLEKNDVA